LSLEPVSLTELLEDCQAMIEPQARKQEIHVQFPALDAPWLVRADRTRVKQVMLNLLSNAIKYNRRKGSVNVSCGPGAAAGRTRMSFRDTGAGLEPGQLAQLFQPFNRLGQEGQGQEGTGIGLVMSKRLVELMGGVIGVESVVGEGSLFWVEFAETTAPTWPPETAGLVRGPSVIPKPGQTRQTLLCVEDNPANLLLVQRLMARRHDVRLLCAPDGLLGVEMARSSLPDVVLMDINLPGINGITAMRMLAEDPQTAHIPVIALSANAMPRDIEKGLRAGFFRYLTKPILVPEFMETLDAALERAANTAIGPQKAPSP
jgi:CheY-like chemotaxis protein